MCANQLLFIISEHLLTWLDMEHGAETSSVPFSSYGAPFKDGQHTSG